MSTCATSNDLLTTSTSGAHASLTQPRPCLLILFCFRLDVSQHMALCRHFVRELRRSVLFETPDLDKAGSKRSSQVLNDLDPNTPIDPNNPDQGPSASRSIRSALSAPRYHDRQDSQEQQRLRKSEDQRLSAFLRSSHGDDRSTPGSQHGHSQKDSSETNKSRDQSTPATPATGRLDGLEQPRPSFMTSNFGDSSGNNSSPQHTVNRSDLRASAEKILYTYLLPGSEREIILPQTVLNEITESIEEQGRDDPEVFDAAKDYVFQAMERDAFPGFLRAKALGNLVPPSMLVRLIVGLLALFGAFWTAFALVFLDQDRPTRVWVLLPFAVGVYALACHQYTLDPLLAFAGYSELTFFSFVKVRERYVRRLLRKRSVVVMSWIVWITAALVVLFVFVPGKRL